MNIHTEEFLNTLALTFIEGIGVMNAKALITECGTATEVFRTSHKKLLKIPGCGTYITSKLRGKSHFLKAEEEINRMEKIGIQALLFHETNYPQRLSFCQDSPVLLFYKGHSNLNFKRVLSIVGTRNISSYGQTLTSQLIEEISRYSPAIISGMAYGVDILAHQKSLEKRLINIACFGHGLDRIYPSSHVALANKILETGTWISEFPCNTKPDRENFPKRNRIVAGISDGTLVIESAEKGGSMITAHLAFDYGREVMAVPGRNNDKYSRGCNKLIKLQKASLVESGEDIAKVLGWDLSDSKPKQLQLNLEDYTLSQQAILESLKDGSMHIDQLEALGILSRGELSMNLLELELKGVIKTLPGKHFCRV